MANTQSTRTQVAAPTPIGAFTEATHGKRIAGTDAPKPCPFCGESDFVEVATVGEPDDDCAQSFHASCGKCGAEGPCSDSMREAAGNWNRRPLAYAEES